MAFETSEAFYAGLSTFDTPRLQSAKQNQDEFNSLYEEAITAFQNNSLDGAGDATKNGMTKTIKTKTEAGNLKSLYSFI